MEDSFVTMNMKKKGLTAIAILGTLLTMLELTSYIIFFHYVSKHNKNVASTILQPSVIKQRNQANAISMVGQIVAWVLEIWYTIFMGFLPIYFKLETVREASALLKNIEYVLIPMVEVYTSAPIRKFNLKSKEH